MTKNIFGVLVALSLVCFSGCDDDLESEQINDEPTVIENSSFLFNDHGTVKYKVHSSDPNVEIQLITLDNRCLLIRYNTEILMEDRHERFEPTVASKISNGNRVDYYYYMTGVNHILNPPTYYIERLIIYQDDKTNSITY
jgi:hypothetical protein